MKYYKEFTNQQGEVVRLEIHQRGYSSTGAQYEIGTLQALKLNIQGDQGGIDQPIVKTSLQFTLVDASDKANTYVGGVRTKYGNWGEFYTPDSTLYWVKLYVNGNPDATYAEDRLVWCGYITPDSWHESLAYRGSVTITARDNLGHLSDFDFDLTGDDWGLVSVNQIVTGALSKINFPMRFYTQIYEGEFRPSLMAVGADVDVTVLDLRVNVSAFDGQTWWDALENILDSIGCVLRFTDYYAFNLMPLRLMPDSGWDDDEWKTINPVMEFYGGSRMLDPAYKEIVEKIDFGQQDKLEYQAIDVTKSTLSSYYNRSCVLEFKNDHVIDPYGQQSSQSNAIQRSARTAGSVAGSGKLGIINELRPSILPEDYDLQDYTKETEGEGFRNYLFSLVNVGSMSISGSNVNITYDNNWPFSFYIRCKSVKLKFKMEFATPAGFDDNGKLGAYPFKLWKLRYQVHYSTKWNPQASGAITRYWTGDNWIENEYTIEKEYDPETEDITSIEESLSGCEAVGEYGYLFIEVVSMVYRTTTYWWTWNGGLVFNVQMSNGVYARLKSISFESELTKKMVSDTVKTVNNASYNVRCSRNPRFGCLSQDVGFIHPSNYQNAFFYIDSNGFPQAAPYLWKWTDRSTQLAFPVQVAMQILQYHAVPLEVLEGAAGMVSKTEKLTFDDGYFYKNVAHLILSAGYNLMTAHFDSVIFRAWTAFSNVSTRSVVASSSSGSGTEAETVEGVTPLKLSEGKLALMESVQTVALAESVEEVTEVQETAPAKTYITPTLESGTALEITDGMTVERVFAASEIRQTVIEEN